MFKKCRGITLPLLMGALVAFSGPVLSKSSDDEVEIKLFAPKKGELAGVESRAFVVDLRVEFPGDLASAGVTPELTGPPPLAGEGPLPGDFGPGHDPSFPGLVVLLSSTNIGAGEGQNVANLFNMVGVTDRSDEDETYIWATWIIGKKGAFGIEGEIVDSRLFVAIVEGEAPDVVEDMNGDGKYSAKDLKMMGYKVISNVKKVDFQVNGF